MPESKSPLGSQAPSAAALFRYQVVCQVRTNVLAGHPLARAVREASARVHEELDGERRRISTRTLYRWLRAYETAGVGALEPAPRKRTATSEVLPEPWVDFVRSEKTSDPAASVPELMRRAPLSGLSVQDVHRSTVWRLCRRVGSDKRPVKHEGDMRRFAYPNRMMMVLSDGKHFRAGATRARRVAMFFLDDATRYGLHVVVGTEGESAELFLRGLFDVVCKFGFMTVLYLDNGAGFISLDTIRIAAQLPGVHLIHGTERYPEGHGKIEKFNQTMQNAVLRSLDGAAEVDPSAPALELRLRHALEQYNDWPHESLAQRTPRQAFQDDPRALAFPRDEHQLRGYFVVTETRKVSKDHVIKWQGKLYEAPYGLSRQKIQLRHHLLDSRLSLIHGDKDVTLSELDQVRNATAGRAQRKPAQAPQPGDLPVPKTAAARAFERDLGSILAPDGGFIEMND
jgi:putative transposase